MVAGLSEGVECAGERMLWEENSSLLVGSGEGVAANWRDLELPLAPSVLGT
jgi:hypothetical protein